MRESAEKWQLTSYLSVIVLLSGLVSLAVQFQPGILQLQG